MTNAFDLVVLGSGPAGASVASRCARDGWSVAMVEDREPGGTCALRGCNPKKVLVHAADLVDRARRSHGRLGRFPDAAIDWRELNAFVREFTGPVPKQTMEKFESEGIRLFRGTARFRDPATIAVGDAVLEGEHILIATGARPMTFSFPGQELLTTSDEFLELRELPARILFVGGGFISLEFAHVAVRAKAEVTVVERETRLLGGFDPDLVERLEQRTRELGITLIKGVEVEGCERGTNGALTVHLTGGQRLDADLVVHGGGRTPNIDDLDLELGEVAHGPRGVEVNRHLRSTSNERVLAAGDCAATRALPLTPAANAHAHAIAQNLLGGQDTHEPDVEALPSVLFTVPPLASVGLGEAEAQERGLEYEVQQGDTSGWTSNKRVGEPCAAYKVLLEPGGGRILGAHLLGPSADETINLFVLALRAGLTGGQLKSAPLAFPTFGHDLRSML